jgi:hypothetical protein
MVQCFSAAWAFFSNLINVFKVASIHEAAEAAEVDPSRRAISELAGLYRSKDAAEAYQALEGQKQTAPDLLADPRAAQVPFPTRLGAH